QREGDVLAGQRVLDRFAMDGNRLARVVAEHTQRTQPIALRATDRCAHVQRIERGQLIEMLVHEIGELQQQVLPLERLELAPGTIEGTPSRFDGAVSLSAVALPNSGKHFAGRGIDGLKCLARGSFDPFAVDQHTFRLAIQKRMAGGLDIYGHGADSFSKVTVRKHRLSFRHAAKAPCGRPSHTAVSYRPARAERYSCLTIALTWREAKSITAQRGGACAGLSLSSVRAASRRAGSPWPLRGSSGLVRHACAQCPAGHWPPMPSRPIGVSQGRRY